MRRAVLVALCCLGCAGRQAAYTVTPLPTVVHPPGRVWGLDMSIEVSDAIRLKLVNTSREPVKVLWEECAYIDTANRSHRLLTSQARSAAAPLVQAPSVIAPGTTLEEVLVAADRVQGRGSDPLLATRVAKPKRLAGKELGLFLVFERSGEHKQVLAKYRIKQVGAQRRRRTRHGGDD